MPKLLPLEEWRRIAGFPAYEVSNQGRVRSNVAFSGADADAAVALLIKPEDDASDWRKDK